MAAVLFLLQCYLVGVAAHDSEFHPCPRGSYRALNPHVCELCPKGRYGSTSGLTSALCTAPCPIGTYNDQYGAQTPDDCQDCPAGYYGSTTGLTTSECTAPCMVGTYGKLPRQTSQASCSVCLTGYYMYQCNSERQYSAGVGFVPPRTDLHVT